MSPTQQLQKFAQKIHLTLRNRYFDDIDSTDGEIFVNQVVDGVNMFMDELENTVDPSSGQLVDWWFTRESGYELGSATEGEASILMPSGVQRLITDEERYVQVTQDGTPVSNWRVVHPRDIGNRSNLITEDMCALVGQSIVFSRAFLDTEEGGTIIGDVILDLPRLSSGTSTNIKALNLVKPLQLLVLGAAKNMALPDNVQGVLTPSFSKKYDTLLLGAIARSKASSIAAQASRENFSGIRGVF